MKKKRNKKTRGRRKAQSCKMQKDQKTRARKESAKEKNRRSTRDFKLATFVANFRSGQRIEKSQILRSLQITAAMAEHRATAEENARATDLKKKKKHKRRAAPPASEQSTPWCYCWLVFARRLAKPP
jgi:hypothetical protein